MSFVSYLLKIGTLDFFASEYWKFFFFKEKFLLEGEIQYNFCHEVMESTGKFLISVSSDKSFTSDFGKKNLNLEQ